MKKSISKAFFAAVVFSVVMISCEDKNEELNDEQLQEVNETPTKDAVLPTEVSEESKEVAVIQKNGREYRFIAVGENDDMVVLKRLYGDAEENDKDSNFDEAKTPFDIFVAITENKLQVPERIAITAKGSALQNSGREVQELDSKITILDQNYSDNAAQKACYDIGYTGFRNSHCGGVPVVSTPSDIRFCDSGLWTSLTRSSYYGGAWREVDDTYTRTNVKCGLTRIQFYAWESSGIWPFNSWAWHLKYQADLPNGIWYAWYNTSSNTERQVKRTRPTNSGSFRAYTRFY